MAVGLKFSSKVLDSFEMKSTRQFRNASPRIAHDEVGRGTKRFRSMTEFALFCRNEPCRMGTRSTVKNRGKDTSFILSDR